MNAHGPTVFDVVDPIPAGHGSGDVEESLACPITDELIHPPMAAKNEG